MTHAERLRDMAKDHLIAGNDQIADALLAGAEALDALERVRAVLTDLRDQQEAAWQSWEAYDDIWDGAVSDTIRYTIHRITEALEGDA